MNVFSLKGYRQGYYRMASVETDLRKAHLLRMRYLIMTNTLALAPLSWGLV